MSARQQRGHAPSLSEARSSRDHAVHNAQQDGGLEIFGAKCVELFRRILPRFMATQAGLWQIERVANREIWKCRDGRHLKLRRVERRFHACVRVSPPRSDGRLFSCERVSLHNSNLSDSVDGLPLRRHETSASSKILASFRSCVSKPSVNQS
jgi:hypothetical protein